LEYRPYAVEKAARLSADKWILERLWNQFEIADNTKLVSCPSMKEVHGTTQKSSRF